MEHYLDIKGVCAVTKMKEPTVRKYIRCEEIPYIRVGRMIRFRPSQIEAWLLGKERNTVTADAPRKGEAASGGLFDGL
jgi:excisionase family DNA binding protein